MTEQPGYGYPPGYQNGPGQQPPYMAPQLIYPAQVVPMSGYATSSLVWGLFGVFGGWCLFGIPCVIAVVCGHAALRDTRTGARGGHGLAVAGLTLGYVFVVPMIVVTIMGIFGGLFHALAPEIPRTP
ncbi:DUF4190 domain-containing protein [Sphaerisporangium sp. NPDC051011]|uniref:DUF4190 domain-containing protein n=1 Tax=Sphaerisporangium sp. NPDC051011 TaxID=3155792 RepID=UPI003404138A